ncbi:MAG: DUF1553 domain-containing protein, partial [Verrucomicrobiota bacterium]
EQLAGDMLPNATLEQKIASGFHRNVMTNDEGGADPEEYLNKYIVDRVNTTANVWLGTTLGCAECHDHKYDRISQKEFYQFYAFFHNVPEKGLDGTRTENPLPRLSVPSPQQAAELIELDRTVQEADNVFRARESELPAAQAKWEEETRAKPVPPENRAGLLAQFELNESLAALTIGETFEASLKNAEAPSWAEGKIGRSLKFDGKAHLDLGQRIAFERTNAFSYGAWIRLQEKTGCILSKMEKDPTYRGFDLLAQNGKFEVHLVHKWPDNGLKVLTKESFPANTWLHVMVTCDGSSKAKGIKIFVNGKARDLEVANDKLTDSLTNSVPLLVGDRNGSFPFNGAIDDLRFYDRALSPEEVAGLVSAANLTLVAIPMEKRTTEQSEDLKRFFRENFASEFKQAEQALARARENKNQLLRRIPNTMVMAEMEKPRDTFMLVRGNFQSKGEKVTADVPSFLPPLPSGAPANRLSLARWLMDANHPLTSRVTVNRYWAMFFGAGLVKTVNDFGSQGEWPTHPELLEWLACQFRDGGGSVRARPWDVKSLVRLIVTSATYRQSAAVTPDRLARDPYNRLLTRGPRLRLDAEFIRDNALAISGLLNRKIGGESVRPYQPPGLWDVTDTKFEQSKGEDLYRRGLYVYWKRAVHYPSFATFDAPNREVCTAQRPRTSTPLQSLVLMNDPVYVEAARGLAQRVLREANLDAPGRLTYAFRLVLARAPTKQELAILRRTLDQQLKHFENDRDGANAFLSVGESPRPPDANVTELAAYTAVANVLLNLNETITK